MSDRNQPLNFYEILGVSRNASTDEIQSAYRREAMQWHPDRNKSPDAERMMRLINQSWEVLSDSGKRAEHDREIAERARYYESHTSQRDPFEEFQESILPFLLERTIDLYDVLDISTNATFEEIEIAYLYRQETIENNPNFSGDSAATAFMSLVRIARFVLGDPEFRAEYDRQFFLLRSRIAEQERARQEVARREFERQERERQREQARREAELRRQREEAERRRRQEERKAREQREREKRRVEQQRRQRERRRTEELRRVREEAEKRRREEEREARERQVREEHERRQRQKRRTEEQRKAAERQRRGNEAQGTGGAGSANRTNFDQNGRNYFRSFVFIILFAILATSAAFAISYWPNEVSAPEPTSTPTPFPAPTAEPHTNPTIAIGIARNGPEGVERIANIRFDDLTHGNARYSYVVSSSDHRCHGPGMGNFISIGVGEESNVAREVTISASCPPGIHKFNVKLYRGATVIVERQIVFGVASSTPTPSPTPASTHSPVPTSTPTHTPTLTPTQMPTPTATYTSTPNPTPTPTATYTLTPTATYTPDPTPTPVIVPTPTDTPTPPPTPTHTATPTPTATPKPTKYVAISSGSWHVCALRDNGHVDCWPPAPEFDHGQSLSPEGHEFVSIISGRYHSCALRENGKTECWGSNDEGQLRAPKDETFASIHSGVSALHTCGLRHDGSAVCWGAIGGQYDYGQASPPSETGFLSLSSGFAHTCGISEDNETVCWGVEEFDYGQARPTHDDAHYYVSISSGFSHTCALRDDGAPVCWGGDNSAFINSEDHGQTNPPLVEKLTAISSGRYHTCGLRNDGIALCWDESKLQGKGIDRGQASPPTGEKFTSISSGRDHTCGLRLDGNVECWGALELDTAQLNQAQAFTSDTDGMTTPANQPTETQMPTPTKTVTPSPSPTPTMTPTYTPTTIPTPTPEPTATPKPKWTGSPTILHDLLANSYVTAEEVKLLIDAGAPVDSLDQYGRTPIEYAVQRGWGVQILKTLLDAGSDISNSSTILHDLLANSYLTVEELQLLIDAGAPLHPKDQNGRTPIEYAVQRGWDAQILQTLLNAGASVSNSPAILHELLANSYATVEELQLLIDAGASLHSRAQNGRTLIEYAVQRGWGAQILQTLLNAGADISNSPTILHDLLANSYVTPEEVKLLIDAGAPLDSKDQHGRTPIEYAVQRGWSAEILRTLVDAMNR